MKTTPRGSEEEVDKDLCLDGDEHECYTVMRALIDSKQEWHGTSDGTIPAIGW